MALSLDRQRPGHRPRTDLDWLTAHLGALYESNREGRLIARRASAARLPPRFVFARTRLGCLWRFGAGEPPQEVRELARLAALEPPAVIPPGSPPPSPDRLAPMVRVLERVAPTARVWNGPVFRAEPGAEAERVIEACAADAIVLGDEADPLWVECAAMLGRPLAELRQCAPIAASTHEHRVVSVCRRAGGDATGIVHGRVDTLPSARRHGHATRATAGWMRAALRGGDLPLYAAPWRDRGALGVAHALGLLAFAECWSFD